MSHLRDLQKLRNTKRIQFQSTRNSQHHTPQICKFNFENFGQTDSRQINPQNYNKYLQSKELVPKIRQHKTHRRGVSNGYTSHDRRDKEKQQKREFMSPGLSIYNFSVKLTHRRTNPLTSRRQKAVDFLQSQKVKNVKEKQAMGRSCFTVLYPVGKGGFGKVWKVQLKRNQQVFAMKEMYKAKIIQKKSINSVMNQRTLLAKVRHPFLVNMSYAFQDRQNLYLLMDYLDGGDLRYHIGKHRSFSQKQTKFFIANIIIGLQYLHGCRIIHRDIKPENLVLDSHGYIRITDLGVSREMRDENHQDTSGTPGYMAPQVMCRKNHSYAADYFAVGVIGYEFMLGRRPYNGRNRKEIRDQVLSKQAAVRIDQLPYKWSPEAADCINKLLMRNPDDRLGNKGIGEIKQHRWFSDIDWEKMKTKKLPAPYIPMSIQDDYEEYKEQISEDTIVENMEENLLMLRQCEVQNLFEGYAYDTSQQIERKRTTSYATNYTDSENPSKLDFRK